MKAWICMLLVLFAASANAAELPAPVKALQQQGLTIRGEMPAPKGFRGYIAEYRGDVMPVYLLPDGKHTVIGTLYDANGEDLTSDAFADAVQPKLGAADWKALADSIWIAEGARQPKRVVYVFSDTECPYCHRLWQEVQPLLAGGDVQVRYIMVAVIKQASLGRAAAVLTAKDPAAALRSHEAHYADSPIKPLQDIPADMHQRIVANNHLMNRLGAFGTPAIVYRDADGKVHMIAGLPQDPARLKAIFGS